MKENNNFNNWNNLKQNIEYLQRTSSVNIRNREVWYINIGKNIGFESNGKGNDFKRPVLVIKRLGSMYFVISMTTKGKGNKFYYEINKKHFNKESFLTLSQFKTVDKKRFIEKIGKIDLEEFIEIKKNLKSFIF